MTDEKRREYMKRYNAENKERIADRKRQYYEEHKEKYREASRKYYQSHKEIVKGRIAVCNDRKAIQSIRETPEDPQLTAEIRRRIFGDETEIRDISRIESPESPKIPNEIRKTKKEER